MKLAWCSDIHLDFLDRTPDEALETFIRPLSDVDCDAVMITGDIATSDCVISHLETMASVLNKPVYFVLGNHDFYGGSFDSVRTAVRKLVAARPNLKYLTGSRSVKLTPHTALVGDDGWYDAYHGDPARSPYVMTDWHRIEDYVNAGAMHVSGLYGDTSRNIGTVISISRRAAFDASERMSIALDEAARVRSTVVVATHVPPWPLSHPSSGKISSAATQPWYTSRMMGDAIEAAAVTHPDVKFEVFCGHVHGRSSTRILPNVNYNVAPAEYGSPRTQIVEVK